MVLPGAGFGSEVCDVKNREQEDPDNVHEVPVQPDQFHTLEVAALEHVLGDHRHDDHAAQHVQGVQPRRGEVERPEDVAEDRDRLMRCGCMVPLRENLRSVLVEFHDHEHQAAEDGEPDVIEGLFKNSKMSSLFQIDDEIDRLVEKFAEQLRDKLKKAVIRSE